MARRVIMASEPAQSVRNLLQYPVSDRMFMKMSGAPCWLAKSRSWCTGMKSRDAIAPATMRVGVTATTIAGNSAPTLSVRQSRVARSSRIGGHRCEERQHHTVVERFEAHGDRHADGHGFRSDPDDVGHQPCPLGQIDERHDVRLREPRQWRVVRDHEAEHGPPPRRLDRVPHERATRRAHRARRMTERAASVALLDQQAMLPY